MIRKASTAAHFLRCCCIGILMRPGTTICSWYFCLCVFFIDHPSTPQTNSAFKDGVLLLWASVSMWEEVEPPNKFLGASPQKEKHENEKICVTMTLRGQSAVTAREQKVAEEDAAHRALCCDFRDTLVAVLLMTARRTLSRISAVVFWFPWCIKTEWIGRRLRSVSSIMLEWGGPIPKITVLSF